MGGQKFQYDESGGTFFYFILSFLALILIPATFYLWPKKKKLGKLLYVCFNWFWPVGQHFKIMFEIN